MSFSLLEKKEFGARKTLELHKAQTKSEQKEIIDKLKPCQIRGSLNALTSICCVVFVNASMLPNCFCLWIFVFCSSLRFSRWVFWIYAVLQSVINIVFFTPLFFVPFILANWYLYEIERHFDLAQSKYANRKKKNLPETSFISKFIYSNYIYCVQMQFGILNQLLLH